MSSDDLSTGGGDVLGLRRDGLLMLSEDKELRFDAIAAGAEEGLERLGLGGLGDGLGRLEDGLGWLFEDCWEAWRSRADV